MLVASYLALRFLKESPGEKAYLCQDCRFNRADLCLKQERPEALECTSYRPGQPANQPDLQDKDSDEAT